MVEDEGADAGLRLHHHAFGQLHADIAGLEQLPHALLIVQIGTRRVAEAVALAVLLRREGIVDGHGGRVGEAPIFADAAVQPLRRGLGGFEAWALKNAPAFFHSSLFSRIPAPAVTTMSARWSRLLSSLSRRSEERRVGKEC